MNTRFMRYSLAIALAVLLAAAACSPAPEPPPTTETPRTAAKLVFTTQPVGAAAGVPFATQPVVTALDSSGNVVTGYRTLLVLTVTAGTGAGDTRLYGGSTVIPSNGLFRFTGLSMDRAGAGYTLTAKSGSLSAVSAPFDVTPGAAAKLEFTAQPSGGVAGKPFATQPEVTVQDSYGNAVANYDGSVSLSITYGSGPGKAKLSGGSTVRAVNSVARFTDLSVDVANPEYTLTAVSGSLASATSLRFEILNSEAVKLEFTVQTEGAVAGKPFESQPKVAVEDVFGNVVTTSRASITVSITPGTGVAGAVLSGTKTLIAENGLGGLAEFSDLSIDRAGRGYTLTATSDGLKPGVSQAFDVAAP